MTLPDDITVVLKDFPPGKIHEAVRQRPDGTFLVLIDSRLNYEQRLNEYRHALLHIERGDFDKTDVQRIEAEAHGLVKPLPIEPPVKTAKRRKPRWLTMMEKRIELLEAFGIDPNEHALDEQDRTVM